MMMPPSTAIVPRKARARVAAALTGVAVAIGTIQPASAAPGVSLGLYGLHGSPWGDEYEYGPNPYFLGLEAQGGVTLPGGLYLGASLQQFYSFLAKETLTSDPPIYIERSAWQTRLLGYVGYSWDLVAVIFRPSLGVGYALTARLTESSGRDGESATATTTNGLVLTPGLEARFPLGTFSLGLQLRYETVLTEGNDIDALIGGVGLGLDL
jgi:hypothetical protein